MVDDPLFRNDAPDVSEVLRSGLDQLDKAASLAETIKQLQGQIEEGLARMAAMRGHLPPEYHSTFDVLVEQGYMPMVEAKRTTIAGYEKARRELRANARKSARDG